MFVDVQPHTVLKQSDGFIHALVPGQIGADGVPDDIGQLIVRPVELGNVVNEGFVPLNILLRYGGPGIDLRICGFRKVIPAYQLKITKFFWIAASFICTQELSPDQLFIIRQVHRDADARP